MLCCDEVEVEPSFTRALVETPTGLRTIPDESLSNHDGALVTEMIEAKGFTIKRNYNNDTFSIATNKRQDLKSVSRLIGNYFRTNDMPVNMQRVSTGMHNLKSYGLWLASTDGKPLRVSPDCEMQGDGRDFTLFPGTGSSRGSIYEFLRKSCKVYASEIQI